MTEAGISQIMRTIPLLIIIFSLSFPARGKRGSEIVALSHYLLGLAGGTYMCDRIN